MDLMARKNVNSVADEMVILAGMPEERADCLAEVLSTGRWTHDHPVFFKDALKLGLPVSDELPDEVYQLMELYPQAGGGRPSVQYIPTPYRSREDQPSQSE